MRDPSRKPSIQTLCESSKWRIQVSGLFSILASCFHILHPQLFIHVQPIALSVSQLSTEEYSASSNIIFLVCSSFTPGWKDPGTGLSAYILQHRLCRLDLRGIFDKQLLSPRLGRDCVHCETFYHSFSGPCLPCCSLITINILFLWIKCQEYPCPRTNWSLALCFFVTRKSSKGLWVIRIYHQNHKLPADWNKRYRILYSHARLLKPSGKYQYHRLVLLL